MEATLSPHPHVPEPIKEPTHLADLKALVVEFTHAAGPERTAPARGRSAEQRLDPAKLVVDYRLRLDSFWTDQRATVEAFEQARRDGDPGGYKQLGRDLDKAGVGDAALAGILRDFAAATSPFESGYDAGEILRTGRRVLDAVKTVRQQLEKRPLTLSYAAALDGTITAITKQVSDRLSALGAGKTVEAASLENRAAELSKHVAQVAAAATAPMQTAIDALTTRSTVSTTAIGKITDQINGLKAQVAATTDPTELAKLNDKIERLQRNAEHHQREIADAMTKVSPLQTRLNDVKELSDNIFEQMTGGVSSVVKQLDNAKKALYNNLKAALAPTDAAAATSKFETLLKDADLATGLNDISRQLDVRQADPEKLARKTSDFVEQIDALITATGVILAGDGAESDIRDQFAAALGAAGRYVDREFSYWVEHGFFAG